MSFTRTLRAVGGAAVAGALLFGTAPVASADSIRDSQWPLTSFSADKVWKVSTGKGVTVAVIDNGVNGDHQDLKGNVLAGKNFSTGAPADHETKNEHGTEMASIIAGHGHGAGGASGVMGLAPDAKILPIKYWDSDGTYLSTTSWAEPLRYAVDHGATVINMSFIDPQMSDDEKQAVAYAVKHDVVLVAGAGNSGVSTREYPAAADGVIAVGAVGPTLKIWEDSNFGPHLLLAAPGQQIRVASASGGYDASKGTSDATAYVSAAAALLRSKFPDLTAGQIANRLTKTALIPSGANVSKTPDAHYGYGIIRPYRALTDDIPAGSKNGPLTMPDLSAVSDSPSSGTAADNSAAESNDTSPTVLGVLGFGLIVVVVVVVIVVVIMVVRSKNKRRNGPPPGGGGAGGWGGGGGQPYPPQQTGYPPNQQNPYASQQQPPNQWPGQ